MPRYVPPQYVRSSRRQGAVVDPSVRANLSVRTWYMDLERQSIGLAARTARAYRALVKSTENFMLIFSRKNEFFSNQCPLQ